MSGDPTEYNDVEIDELYDALSEAFEEYEAGGGAGSSEVTARITVTAKVEWAGEYANNGRDGQRTVRLNPMDLTAVRDAVRTAQRLEGLAGRGPGGGWVEARKEAADALSTALANEYGSGIRFRGISDLRFR